MGNAGSRTRQLMSANNLFSRQAWDRNAATYETIRTMPFNAQLASGSLSESRFKHYITQDAHYLVGFGRALGARPIAGDIDRRRGIPQLAAGPFDGGHATSLAACRLRFAL